MLKDVSVSVVMETSKRSDVLLPRDEDRGDLFLLGRRTCLLEQCLKLLVERFDSSIKNKDKFFRAKLKETLFHLQTFCEQLAEGSDLGASEEPESARATARDFAENRFSELAVDYFRLRLCLLCSWTFDEASSFSSFDETFIKREYACMFPKRTDGSGRPSLEYRNLAAPSLAWIKKGSCFRLLDLHLKALVETCLTVQLDLFEIENLGMGAGEVEVFAKGLEDGSASEQDASRIWPEIAVALLANTVALDRLLLLGVRARREARIAAGSGEEREDEEDFREEEEADDDSSDSGP